MAGIIYILVNSFMPDIFKIGRTERNVEDRIKELDTTSMPAPFQCVYAAEVNDVVIVEKRIQRIFSDKRIRKNREFFEKVLLQQLIEATKLAEIREVTLKNDIFNEPSDKEVLEKCSEVEERKNKWAFKDLRIPVNSILYFSKDDSVTSIVADENSNRVIFEGVNMSLSASSLKALNKIGYTWSSVRGSDYWMYEDETLTTRRLELESIE